MVTRMHSATASLDDAFPQAVPGFCSPSGFLRSEAPLECCHCGRQTHWLNVGLLLYFCSEKCQQDFSQEFQAWRGRTSGPRYFAIGRDYSPLRGYIRCDDRKTSFLTVPPGSGECRVPLSCADCVRRVSAGRLVEVTKEHIDEMNALWASNQHARRLHELRFLDPPSPHAVAALRAT